MKIRRQWTVKDEMFIRSNYDILPPKEISKKLNRTYLSIKSRMYLLGFKAKVSEYAVYKGEKLIVMGTAKECADFVGVTQQYIRFMTTPTGKKRLAARGNPDDCTTAVNLGKVEKDED